MLKTVSTANGLVSPTFSGDVTLSTGNLVIGTSGKGIDFSADPSAAGMTSELFDDYEEGTWTPSLTFGGATTGITYIAGFQNGIYVKVGGLITVTGVIYLSNKGSATGSAAISGVPYISANINGAQSAASLRLSAIGFNNYPMLAVDKNGNFFSFAESTTAGVVTPITDADFANNSYVQFSMTYRSI